MTLHLQPSPEPMTREIEETRHRYLIAVRCAALTGTPKAILDHEGEAVREAVHGIAALLCHNDRREP